MAASDHINIHQLSSWVPSSDDHHELKQDMEEHEDALRAFMNGKAGDPMDEFGGWAGDEELHPRMVNPSDTAHNPHPANDHRVARAMEGYRTDPDVVPPVMLVNRAGKHEVVDGSHRLSAAKHLGIDSVRAWVADSPRTDEWTPPDY